MWPGLHVPTLAKANGQAEPRPQKRAFKNLKEDAEEIDALLRISAGKRDLILPAKCLNELPAETSSSELRDILEKNAIASIPGSGLNQIEKYSGKPTVCVSGRTLDETAKLCQERGLQCEVLSSQEGSKFYDAHRSAEPFVPLQSLTVIEDGKKLPFIKPRTRLSAEHRSKMQLAPSVRSQFAVASAPEPSQVDESTVAKARAERAVTSILQQIDFIIDESLGFFGDDSLEPAPALRAALQVMPMIAAPEPPELSLLHEELAASMASVSREFPKGVVPVECRGEPEGAGMIRAKAVRIRGSPESAYPFIKSAGPPEQQQQEMLPDPGGIEE